MDWVSFISGALCTAFTYALFKSEREEPEEEEVTESDDNEELLITGHTGRTVVLSCQSCRKLKRHREIEPDLYECYKCKRRVDLRRAS
ncbi:hypothetical protein [Cytobacillus firmus]|uniref:hypothetical protein n=1 Tax=Cytobacillus firmus TaxID=1399 RepID=UPI0018CECFEE|nr:hypothetical protein [Cytobacillus firmus]MBG9548368.1 hypothetical protein [Cytobacillus firmus]MBG9600782.1 hypothetical protein [Cytobacillus firmus]MED1938966.1 hypothetical protein [Cytobacillus firmus]